ncbi:DUF262 domain-containing protein [Methanobacterium formicicum]|uniref:DUF262 domain-containing protein n=1 Tax=Methanobacterium formicicum TaxID=2162 RepID=A0A843APM5_METFO|nr:DUF262 domain-containing HNH endonuclease family protein [Methanobacterium formicicum]MBF4475461.1 DUF262 domain-containing protein [Methanobacterium formicicum]
MKDLPTLQDLFENSVFRIPDYQRGYSWENNHRKDLLEDLEAIQGKGHYTGTIVLKESEKINWYSKTFKKYDVVDGQQRITTILILLDLIAKELTKINTKDSVLIANNIRETYIRIESSLESLDKLELDEDNREYFKEVIIGSITSERRIKSHDRLFDAKNQFQEYLNSKKRSNSDYFHFLNDLIIRITQLLIFTRYDVEDDAEVGVIFEVMNDRGKPLSQLEKVKNRLLFLTDRISETDSAKVDLTDYINKSWKIILENLSKTGKSKNEDENHFLRLNFIINFYSELKTYKENGKRIGINTQLSDIHKLVKEHFKILEKTDKNECYHEIRNYVSSLRSTSFKYRDILAPYNGTAYQNLKNKEELKLVSSQFGRLNIQSNVLTLLLSIYERFQTDAEELVRLMEVCEIFVFRLYYIGGWMSNTAQSKIYSLSNSIFHDELSSDEIYSSIKEILEGYIPKSEIENCLTNPKIDYYHWKGIRYFLYEYERIRCQEKTHKRPAFDWDDFKNMKKEDSVEHILPQTIRGKTRINYWAGRFDPKKHEKNVKRIGNLTLTTRNPELQNMTFPKKKLIYKDSSWEIEREIAKYSDWTEKQIDEREQELINFAYSRWVIDKEE